MVTTERSRLPSSPIDRRPTRRVRPLPTLLAAAAGLVPAVAGAVVRERWFIADGAFYFPVTAVTFADWMPYCTGREDKVYPDKQLTVHICAVERRGDDDDGLPTAWTAAPVTSEAPRGARVALKRLQPR